MRPKRERKQVNYKIVLPLDSSSDEKMSDVEEGAVESDDTGTSAEDVFTAEDASSSSSEEISEQGESEDSGSAPEEPDDEPTVAVAIRKTFVPNIPKLQPKIAPKAIPVRRFVPKVPVAEVAKPVQPFVVEVVEKPKPVPKPAPRPVQEPAKAIPADFIRDPAVMKFKEMCFEALKINDIVRIVDLPAYKKSNVGRKPAKNAPPSSTQVSEGEEGPTPVIKVEFNRANRMPCYFPPCPNDYLQKEGCIAHFKTQIHDVYDFMRWAFPKKNEKPTAKSLAADEKRWDEEHVFSKVRDDVVALYKAIPEAAWPIKIEGYVTMFPATASRHSIPLLLGVSKERRATMAVPPIPVEPRKKKWVPDMSAEPSVSASSAHFNVLDISDRDHITKGELLELAETPLREQVKAAVDARELQLNAAEDLASKYQHKAVKCRAEQFKILTHSQALVHLSQAKGVNLTITHGKQKDQISLLPLQAHRSSGSSVTCCVGGTIHALDWCPGVPKDGPMYVAVGGYPDTQIPKKASDPIRGLFSRDEGYNWIQIWQVGVSSLSKLKQPDTKLDLCMFVPHGTIRDLSWCQYGGWEASDGSGLKRLGLLSVVFGDGSLRVYAVPQPETIQKELPVYLDNVKPVFEVVSKEMTFTTCRWGGSEWLAAGTVEGFVAVWDMESIFNVADSKGKTPIHKLPQSAVGDPSIVAKIHDTVITDLDWNNVRLINPKLPRPMQLVTTSLDGTCKIFDVRNTLQSMVVARFRYFIHSVKWAPNHGWLDSSKKQIAQGNGFIVYPERDFLVRVTWPADCDVAAGDDDKGLRSFAVSQHDALIWSLDASRFHPFVLSGGADGTVRFSNVHRSTERHHRPRVTTVFKASMQVGDEVEGFLPGRIMIREGLRGEELVANKTLNVMPNIDVYCQVYKTRWCPHPSAHGYIASGLSGGLLRIDSVY